MKYEMSLIILDLLEPIENDAACRDLNARVDELVEAFDLDLKHVDSKPALEKIAVTSVVLQSDGQVTLNYQLHWSSFHPCHDRHESGIVHRSVIGAWADGRLHLPRFCPVEARSTADEL